MSPAQRHALDPISLQHIVDGIAGLLHWVFVVSLVMALLCLVVARLIPARQPE